MESINAPKVVVVSYYSGLEGYVSSEWADDKGLGLKSLGFSTILLTSKSGRPDSKLWGEIHQASSISWIDFQRELKDCKLENSDVNGGTRLIVATLGRMLDWLEKAVLGVHSDGRLTWFLSALPLAIKLALENPKSVFLFLGGPSSSHLLSLVVGGIFRRRCISELQDPLFSKHMAVSKVAEFSLKILEGLLLKVNAKLVLTSETAAREFNFRHASKNKLAETIIPGSPLRTLSLPLQNEPQNLFDLTFVHIGTLYGSRNLNQILEAISSIENQLGELTVGIRNIGYVEKSLVERYEADSRVDLLPPTSRQEALSIASKCNATLLIQHNDARSEVTIPYKIFDYLNLELPCLAFVKSAELRGLSETWGLQTISVDSDVAETASLVLEFIMTLKNRDVPSKISFEEQVSKLMDIG
jgi:hypothetical protein